MIQNKCVYVYLDHRKPGEYIYGDLKFYFEPIYVGKGNLKRPNRHKLLYKKSNNRFYSKLKSIVKETNIFPNYLILKKNLNENEANIEEINFIKKIKRIDNGGTLTNLTDGGEGQSGWIMPESVKKKKSISMTGKKLGCLSEEAKKNISNSKKGKPHKGCKMSNDTKIKMREKKLGIYDGDKNPMFGKNHTQQAKLKISLKNKNKLSGSKHPNYKNKNHINVVAKDTWELTNINSETVIIESLSRFCRENNLNACCMRDIFYGKQKSHKGWIKVIKLTNNVKKKKYK